MVKFSCSRPKLNTDVENVKIVKNVKRVKRVRSVKRVKSVKEQPGRF
jgi:hypothetical protein